MTTMTLAAVAWAWDQRGLTADQKLLLLALGDRSTDDGPPPDLGHAFAESDLDADQGREILVELLDLGLIDAEHRTAER
jgi:hypothetical protein